MRSSGWQVAGRAAEVYERGLVPAIFAPWASRLVEMAALGPGERVLDAACGTGVVARQSAPMVGPAGFVAGVDVNAEMIAVARSLSAGIEWHEADMQSLPFPDSWFDAAICQFGLMYVADRQAAVAELRRVVVPGGRIVLAVWRSIEHNPGWSLFITALEQHVGAGAAETMRKPFVLGTAEGAAEIRDLVTAAGFGDVRVRIEGEMTRFPSPGDLVRFQAAGSPLAGAFDGLPADSVEALVAGLTDLLRPYTDDDGIAFPSAAYVVTARAPQP